MNRGFDASQFGTELDAEVAEKVMRWTGRANELWTDVDGKVTEWGTDNCVRLNNVTTDKYFEPSTDIAAAWKVLRRVWIMRFSQRKAFMDALTELVREEKGLFIAWPDVLWFVTPGKICLAALKAVEA